jgi:hypothetical protein
MLLITLEPLIVVFVISILSPLLRQRVGVAPLFCFLDDMTDSDVQQPSCLFVANFNYLRTK